MRMCDPRGATTLCNYVNLVNPSDRHILECGGGDRHVHVQKVVNVTIDHALRERYAFSCQQFLNHKLCRTQIYMDTYLYIIGDRSSIKRASSGMASPSSKSCLKI